MSAALQFAVIALGVRHIVVLGHARCGGIRAFAETGAPLSQSDFIGRWIDLVTPALKTAGPRGRAPLEDYLPRLERASLSAGIDNLMTFPWIRERVADGRLALHAAYFDVADGGLLVRDPATGRFHPVAASG